MPDNSQIRLELYNIFVILGEENKVTIILAYPNTVESLIVIYGMNLI
jgi:hypothetical protein